jgi:hypothetical protein
MKFKLLLILSIFASSIFAKQKIANVSGNNVEAYKSIAFVGTWCWFSDPRAVYYEGNFKRTYNGWIDSFGDILISSYN